MPVTTAIDPSTNLITYTVTGDMTLSDVQGAVERVVTDPEFHAGMNSLWNLKEARIAITMQELPAMIGHLAGMVEQRGQGYKVAILVRRNEDFGLSSLFEMNAYTLPFDVQIFRNSREALDWVSNENSPAR